jgi:hypothetical protein
LETGHEQARTLISVILVTPDSYKRVRKTIQCLHRQTSLDKLELVIASPTVELLDHSPDDWEGFYNVKLVATGPFRNTGHPRAVAVSHAAADIIAFRRGSLLSAGGLGRVSRRLAPASVGCNESIA